MSDPTAVDPVIYVRGQRVALGPIRAEHKETFLRYMQDPEVAIPSGGSFQVRSPESLESLWERVSKENHSFCIYDKESLRMIGTTGLHRVDQTNGTAAFGIEIGFKEYWSRGYGTEATRLVLDYGFNHLNLYCISLVAFSFNTRAIAAYKKAGFKEMGGRRGVLLVAGKRYDDVYMDILSSEFTPPQEGWYTL